MLTVEDLDWNRSVSLPPREYLGKSNYLLLVRIAIGDKWAQSKQAVCANNSK